MPVWCPKCNAMLSEGTKECPRCGAKLDHKHAKEDEVSREDILWYSAYTIGLVLVPIVIGVIIGVICILLFVLN